MSMKTISKTRLQIKDQNELINQISGTYKDFYRAAMEYIDNAIDAASILEEQGVNTSHKIEITIDVSKKNICFTDNCGGMSPEELCELLSSVGRSKKKTVPWANGQFGFGVHAFRAFAKEAIFISRKKSEKEAIIKIDRTVDEKKDVPCYETDTRQLSNYGTRVTISKFDAHGFKKKGFIGAIVAEIEHHFDDVLRAKKIKIYVKEEGKKAYECKYFDYSKLAGPILQKTVDVEDDGKKYCIKVDLKVLDRAQDGQLPVLTNKNRRVQTIYELKSFKNYLRSRGEIAYVWSNPFVVGSIEINDLCSPNLTRDDLKDSKQRESLYEAMLQVQIELKALIDDAMDKKTQESFKKIGKIMSDCLSEILKNFKLEFEQLAPSGEAGSFSEEVSDSNGDVPFGGDEPGGGGEGGNQKSSGGEICEDGNHGVGDDSAGGGVGESKVSSKDGMSREKVITSHGPRIEFQNHAGEDRIIDLGNSLIVNTQHSDFILRNPNKTGRVKFDNRILNYISQIVAPYCVHRLFEKKGKVPSVSEVGENIVNLTLKLEHQLSSTVLGHEMEISR